MTDEIAAALERLRAHGREVAIVRDHGRLANLGREIHDAVTALETHLLTLPAKASAADKGAV